MFLDTAYNTFLMCGMHPFMVLSRLSTSWFSSSSTRACVRALTLTPKLILLAEQTFESRSKSIGLVTMKADTKNQGDTYKIPDMSPEPYHGQTCLNNTIMTYIGELVISDVY